jgi:hypothetical protein
VISFTRKKPSTDPPCEVYWTPSMYKETGMANDGNDRATTGCCL